MQKFLRLNDVSSYKRSYSLSNLVWFAVIDWDQFAKNTIGSQFVPAIDSISANIAEGFSRYGKKDKIKFYRYSMGSQKESLDWNEKAKTRNLITDDQYSHILTELLLLPKEINELIRFTNGRLNNLTIKQ